jgi:CrcB protein
MRLIIAIAAGGAIGSVARHYMSAQVARLAGSGFPWGILAVNVLGGFVMGLLVEAMALRFQVSEAWRAFLTVGLLGGFTTFSAFSLDVVLLIERGQTAAALAYIAVSVIASVLALFLGLLLVRLLVP